MVTMQSWMFLSSFEKMRKSILATKTIIDLMHMENMVMGIAFGTAVTVFKNTRIPNFKGTYTHIKLQDIIKDKITENTRPKEFPNYNNRYAEINTDNFSKIPGSPIAYWVSQDVINAFSFNYISDYGDTSKGIITGNNAQFIRYWFEVINTSIEFESTCVNDCIASNKKWFPCNKGGEYRKWFGNNDYVIDWEENGKRIMQRGLEKTRNCQDYQDKWKFIPSITWTSISSSKSSFRYSDKTISESAGMSLFTDSVFYSLGFLNSSVALYLLNVLNPTLNFTAGSISQLPMRILNKESVSNLVEENISLSKEDWDSFETSWDFKKHPLV